MRLVAWLVVAAAAVSLAPMMMVVVCVVLVLSMIVCVVACARGAGVVVVVCDVRVAGGGGGGCGRGGGAPCDDTSVSSAAAAETVMPVCSECCGNVANGIGRASSAAVAPTRTPPHVSPDMARQLMPRNGAIPAACQLGFKPWPFLVHCLV